MKIRPSQVYLRQLDEFWQDKSGAREILIAYNTEKPPMLLNLTRFDYLDKQNDKFDIQELFADKIGRASCRERVLWYV